MSRFYGTTSFEFPLLSNSYMESTNIEGWQDKQNSKNTGGIMRYQLRNFQLFLVVFLTGCTSGSLKNVEKCSKDIGTDLTLYEIG